MLVGIISDSHDDLGSIERAVEIFQRMGVDEIIHLGDLISPFSLNPIINSGIPFRLLRGNNDAEALTAISVLESDGVYYPGPVEVLLSGKKALLFHGFGSKELTKLSAIQLARSGRFDFVIYGHTHEVHVEEVGGTLVINPGESCGKLTGRKSVAILETGEKSVEVLDL